MDIKTKLKVRLLEIPINSKAYREKHRLARDLEVEMADIEPLLNELVDKKILKEKIQYICTSCRDTTTMSDEDLQEILEENEENRFLCDNCMEYVNTATDRTGYVYYDIKDKEALINL